MFLKQFSNRFIITKKSVSMSTYEYVIPVCAESLYVFKEITDALRFRE
jgi:chlorite dismutase